MERQIRRVGIGLVLAFMAVFLQLNYVQIFAAESISENPANRLQLIREYSIKRGEILTLDGKVIARSKPQKGLYKFRRLYPGGELYGHITGWYSVRYGLDRLERTYRDQLLGEGGTLSMQDIQDRFLGSGEEGDDVRTTIASRRVLGMHIPDVKHFGPLLVMWGLSLAVMFYAKDLGSSLLFFSVFLIMIYIATARGVYMAAGIALFSVGAFVGYQKFGHVQERVQVWLDVFDPKHVQDEGFQLAQSLFALSAGGLFGTGLGQGRPDLIPAAHTDFIFSVLGQELGLMGAAAILLCFLLLVGRGLKIALSQRDDFAQLLAVGLIVVIAVQTFIILAGVTRLLPLTGITLPFMSYGGSSLLSNFILIALLARISDQGASAPDPAMTSEILIGGR